MFIILSIFDLFFDRNFLNHSVRGVYLCDDCASIHRQLGRHYSQIKHLTQSDWSTSQIIMLKQLVTLGANKIWEHNLHDPATKSNKGYKAKPKPKDALDAKEAYIKARD